MSPQINDLIASLPEEEFRILTEHMHLVSLQKGQTLFDAGETVTQLYFPVGALVSMIVDQPDGGCVETYMMGNACFVGEGTSGQPSFYRATVRNSGLAYRISVADMRRVIPRCPCMSNTSIRGCSSCSSARRKASTAARNIPWTSS